MRIYTFILRIMGDGVIVDYRKKIVIYSINELIYQFILITEYGVRIMDGVVLE